MEQKIVNFDGTMVGETVDREKQIESLKKLKELVNKNDKDLVNGDRVLENYLKSFNYFIDSLLKKMLLSFKQVDKYLDGVNRILIDNDGLDCLRDVITYTWMVMVSDDKVLGMKDYVVRVFIDSLAETNISPNEYVNNFKRFLDKRVIKLVEDNYEKMTMSHILSDVMVNINLFNGDELYHELQETVDGVLASKTTNKKNGLFDNVEELDEVYFILKEQMEGLNSFRDVPIWDEKCFEILEKIRFLKYLSLDKQSEFFKDIYKLDVEVSSLMEKIDVILRIIMIYYNSMKESNVVIKVNFDESGRKK